jgi:hypothetical protein
MTRPRNKTEGKWLTALRGLRTEKHQAATKRRVKRRLSKARRRAANPMGATLIVANVSRLTRNPDFMGRLVEAGVEVRFCDLPKIEGPAGRFMLRQMLAVAELEAGLISERTKKALERKQVWYAGLTDEQKAELKAKGKATQLGGNRSNLPAVGGKGRTISLAKRQAKARRRAADLAPVIAELQASGPPSYRQIVAGLNARCIRTARGGAWSAVQVKRVLERV